MADQFVIPPNARQLHVFDWTEALEGDTIASASLTPSAGITAEIVEALPTTVTVAITGQQHATRGYVTCRIVKTADGEPDSRTMHFVIIQN